MLVRSFQMKSRKGLVRDVFDTFATRSGLVYDVTDTDCWTQNGSTHDRVAATAKRRFLTNRIRISCEELQHWNYIYIYISSYPPPPPQKKKKKSMGPVVLLWFSPPLSVKGGGWREG